MSFCKKSLYIFSFSFLFLAFSATLTSMALLGASHGIQQVHCNYSTYTVMKECSTCLGDNKTQCDTAHTCGALMLVILILWALFLVRRCRKPGYLRYWRSKWVVHDVGYLFITCTYVCVHTYCRWCILLFALAMIGMIGIATAFSTVLWLILIASDGYLYTECDGVIKRYVCFLCIS